MAQLSFPFELPDSLSFVDVESGGLDNLIVWLLMVQGAETENVVFLGGLLVLDPWVDKIIRHV